MTRPRPGVWLAAPGRCDATGYFDAGEGDFAEFKVAFFTDPQGVVRKVWLLMVLGHSRWLWGRFCARSCLRTPISAGFLRERCAMADIVATRRNDVLQGPSRLIA